MQHGPQFKDNRQFITVFTPILWMLTFWWPLSCGCTVVANGNHRNSFLNLFLCSLPGFKTPFFQVLFFGPPYCSRAQNTHLIFETIIWAVGKKLPKTFFFIQIWWDNFTNFDWCKFCIEKDNQLQRLQEIYVKWRFY